MRKLSDYKGEEAIELWGDLLEIIVPIFTDEKIKNVVEKGQSKITIAKEMVKSHSKEVEKILLRIDPTPINGLNVITRLVAILNEIGEDETLKPFFGFAEQVETDKESSGLPTVNIEEEEK